MDLLVNCLIVFGAVLTVNGKITCIGENGNPVDMFILYKLPHMHGHELTHLSEGKAYAYMDSNSPTFRFGSKAITDEGSPTGLTLNQVYLNYEDASLKNNSSNSERTSDLAHVFYNDQSPDDHKSHGSYGHTKGALAFNKKSGFWLIHSVPKFPPSASNGYEYPHSGLRYGQMMICVTFDANKFDDIGVQLIYNHPHVHDGHLPTAFQKEYPSMQQLLNHKHVTHEPFSHVVNLESLGGTKYRHFAKYTRFHKDLYHDLVAIDLHTDLFTETWQHGHNIGPSCNGDYLVEDIDKINIQLPSQSISFGNMNDHSKFAIGKTGNMPYVCIGDINRQPSQFHRAGGTLCFKNYGIWKQFDSFVDTYFGCE